MNDPPTLAVALLARAGVARDRLREALLQAGMQVVLEEDPEQLQVAQFTAAAPTAVVVALEPAVEDALERLQSVLYAPSLTLVFDEAELVARRDGWDAARWGRHLAAKLQGHQQVLPPGAEDEHAQLPQPGLGALDAHPEVPVADPAWRMEVADAAQGLEGDRLYQMLQAPDAVDTASPPALEPALLEQAPQAGPPGAQADGDQPDADQADAADAPPAAGGYRHWALLDDGAVAPEQDVAETAVASARHFDLDGLSLVAMEDTAPPAAAAPWDREREGVVGAVAVLAGLGGPDALRRLLAALTQPLEVPVLVRMPLDGGRYDNLVSQMARVSLMPVRLANVPAPVEAGTVYVLGDDVGVALNRGVLWFHRDNRGLQLSALPASDSAIILLSGADLAQIDPALDLAEAGAWVAGQVGDGCYDPAAPTAVVAAGMFAGEPRELAEAITQRWALDAPEAC